VLIENGILINESTRRKIKKYKFYLNLLPYEVIKKVSENLNYNILFFIAIFCVFVLIVVCSFLFLNGGIVYDFDKIMQNVNYFHILLLNYFVIIISTTGHELYHAIFAQKYGCYVVEAGVMLKAFLPDRCCRQRHGQHRRHRRKSVHRPCQCQGQCQNDRPGLERNQHHCGCRRKGLP